MVQGEISDFGLKCAQKSWSCSRTSETSNIFRNSYSALVATVPVEPIAPPPAHGASSIIPTGGVSVQSVNDTVELLVRVNTSALVDTLLNNKDRSAQAMALGQALLSSVQTLAPRIAIGQGQANSQNPTISAGGQCQTVSEIGPNFGFNPSTTAHPSNASYNIHKLQAAAERSRQALIASSAFSPFLGNSDQSTALIPGSANMDKVLVHLTQCGQRFRQIGNCPFFLPLLCIWT